MTRRKTVKFKAVKIVKEPTVVKFTQKNGEVVRFKATKGVAKTVDVAFKAKPKKK